ncbi:hypothetical protein AK812_SmicGene41611, partial [Symbiodinium microadriaticum]
MSKASVKTGRLLNEEAVPQLLVLRPGAIRIYAADGKSKKRKPVPDNVLQLSHGCQVSPLPPTGVQIQTRAPCE